MLVKRHQNTLRRVDCVSPMNIEGMVSENIHNDALYDYQLQGLKWMFDNFKSKRSVILAGMFMNSKATMHDSIAGILNISRVFSY
uniref:Uncharacterized protein n=1 Tax=Aegilops tauschii subsp. strangulata TaxID=200361 RepID=A0A453G7G0_AEGTS